MPPKLKIIKRTRRMFLPKSKIEKSKIIFIFNIVHYNPAIDTQSIKNVNPEHYGTQF